MPITPASGRAASEARPDTATQPVAPQSRTGGSIGPRVQPGPEGLNRSAPARREAGQASGEAAKAPPASRMSPLKIKSGGYRLARKVIGKEITDPYTLRTLDDGTDSMQVTQKKLKHSNVRPALVETENLSYFLGAIAQNIGQSVQHTLDQTDLANQQTALIAALGDLVRAGACDTFASDVAHGHAPKLRPGESIERVAATNFHSWVQLHAPGKPVVVLDPWAQDPAVLAEDRILAVERSQGHIHDPQKAARDLEKARAMVLTPEFEQYTQKCLALAQGVEPPDDHLFEPSHFINPALPITAERILSNLPPPEQKRLAMQVARQLGVAPEDEVRVASDILDAAKNLHLR